jgi:hypothetical protein
MHFIQYGMLGALGALAIPIIVHLMFRTRARSVDLGTLQFLRAVLRDNARKRKVRRWILLALRLACVALIALLFARPYLLATEPITGDRLVVVLLDRSASMDLRGGTRPIDRATAEVRALISSASSKTQLEVATFDQAVEPLARATDLAKTTPEVSASGTNYSTAMAWARDLLVRSRKHPKELHILTDLQRSGLDRGESVMLPPDVDVHLSDFGRAFPKNTGVIGVETAPRSIRPGESATVTATVLNASPLPATKLVVRLHLEAGDKKRDMEKSIELEGGAAKTVEFSLPEISEGLWRGHVETSPGDDLPFDDRRYLALSIAPPARVLLANGDSGRSPFESETYFLQAALRLAPPGEHYAKTPFDTDSVDLVGNTALPGLEKTKAVVLANVESLGSSDADRLATFVKAGGGLLVFTGEHVTPDGSRSLESAGLGVGQVIGTATATELPWRFERWEKQHPIFRPFADPEHGDLRRPAFAAITRIKPDNDARVLAWFRGGEPAVLERSVGRGRVVWFTSTCDRGWGDWPRGRLYVPLVHQLVAYVSGLAEGGQIRLETAVGEQKPGIVESGGLLHVVNADPFESETARCTRREFAEKFGFKLPDPASPKNTAQDTADGRGDDRSRGDELWPWLALTLIGFLLVENFLANRTAA